VVSEEKGTISAARNGNIDEVKDPEKLTVILEKFYQELYPKRESKTWADFFKKNSLEKIYAVILTLALWFVLVYGSKMTYQTFVIPVTYTDIRKPWVIESISPEEVEITLRGPRRAFYFTIQDRIKLFLDLKLQSGVQKIRIRTDNLIIPKGVVLGSIDSRYIVAELKKEEENGLQEPALHEEQMNTDNGREQ